MSNRIVRHFFVTVLLLPVSVLCVTAQEKTRAESHYDLKKCAPKIISHTNEKLPEFHFRKGETYRHSPVVAYEVLESGDIANAILKRSSGVDEVDQSALKWVRDLKLNKRLGYGVIESTVDITIDFR